VTGKVGRWSRYSPRSTLARVTLRSTGTWRETSVGLEDPEDEIEIESANGEQKLPLVRVRIRVVGETLGTRITVTDRSELSKDVLLGSRDLGGFLIKPNEERLTSPDDPKE
jgi:hypothetical protein